MYVCMYVYIYIYIYMYIYIYIYIYIKLAVTPVPSARRSPEGQKQTAYNVDAATHTFYNPAKPSGRGGGPPQLGG